METLSAVEYEIMYRTEAWLKKFWAATVQLFFAVLGWFADLLEAVKADAKNEDLVDALTFWLLVVPIAFGWVALLCLHVTMS